MHGIGNQCLAAAEYAAEKLNEKKTEVAPEIYPADMSGTPVTFFTNNRHELKSQTISKIKIQKLKLRNPPLAGDFINFDICILYF
jgi:hypothetical protein